MSGLWVHISDSTFELIESSLEYRSMHPIFLSSSTEALNGAPRVSAQYPIQLPAEVYRWFTIPAGPALGRYAFLRAFVQRSLGNNKHNVA